ncbi:MAG TPA: hypothetical protein DCZ94_12225 [Lentisphaeria bacterium]|nr:MAG: hypothetical protein A2X48_12640 [Lentisphaerae bacterium GWF2_49_21]HBC87716.1 hypothetical protein [Lentisphaeria bacterium]
MDVRTTKKFQSVTVNNWEWSISDPAILEPWFDSWKEVARKNMVKSNRVRAVFKVESGGKTYYVKFNHPLSLASRIHSSIIPKSKSEFLSALQLKEHGIPSIEICGWARKGHESMLITRELENSVNARNYWFSEASTRAELKEKFLDSFSEFLRKIMSSCFFHPDFHLGNLMLGKDDMKFSLVDPYGVEKKSRLTDAQVFKMIRIIGSFRGEINDREAGEILLKARLAKDFSAADEIWYDVLKAEADEMEKLWAKRKEQVLAGKASYCRVFQSALGQGMSIRNSMDGRAMIDNRILMDENFEKRYQSVRLTEAEARELWLISFHLQFHRITHKMPLAWIKINEAENILVYPKTVIINTIKTETVGEFLKRCRAAGIKKDISPRLAESEDGRIYLSDIRDLL